MRKRIFYIAMLTICSWSARAQTMTDADAMYKQFMFMRADTSFTKEQIYVKALECTKVYKTILTATPSGVDGYDKCKSVLTSLYPFLKGGAGHCSQVHKDSLAMAFAKTAIGVAMMKEMQTEGLRKDSYYPQLVYFVAARTYNAEQYDDAILYLKEYMDVTDVSKHPRVLQFLKEAEGIVAQRKKSEEEFVDIYKGVPDFDVFAKASIEKSMNEWKVKDPYETIDEYKLRVNETTAKKKQEDLQKILMDEYVQRFAKQMGVQDLKIKPYDAENQSFLIESPYGDIVLNVPRSNNEARDFADNWNNVKVYNQNFVISNRKLALAGLTFSTPAGKIYTYSNQKALAYNETQINANFTEIDYSMLANSKGSENKTKIGKKEVVVGVSDVDVNIPKSKGNNDKTFAVIIANEDYTAVPPVPMAGNDGKVFAQYCEQTLGLPKENIRQYPNATYGVMIRAIQDITNIASAYNDIRVIFYYAGHGIPNESSRDAFLLPIDADGSQTEACYPLKKLYGELSALGAKQVVVFLDACFSGSTGEGGTLMANARGVALVARQERPTGNLIVFSAASDDQTAFPYKDQGHGMFTYYLLKKLQSTKGNVSLGDLGQYIIDNVKQKSVVLNRKLQTPTVTCSSDLTGDWRNIKLNK
ncbi:MULTISPECIES: caspase family protein [unclassified Prevotella]|uniref:caspase family protein n=1 Tax=unclassified Prevotella TaxID=2638335 RepID=UPI0009E02399|nr:MULTISPECIES: caspase family protein [unclassified Prevotella]